MKNRRIALLLILALFGFIFSPYFVAPVKAAPLTFVTVRPDRMAINVASVSYLIIVKEVSSGTDTSVKVAFPATFDVTGAAATVTGVPSTYHGHSVTNLPGIGTATISSQEVTVPATDLNTSSYYGFIITGITNGSSTGVKTFTVTTQASGPTTIDTSDIGVYMVNDNGGSTDSDQIVVTASVAPTFTLDLGANADSVTTALGSVAFGTGVTATAKTNAQAGYSIWLKSGTNSGLTSATTSTSIAFGGTAADATPTTIVAGTEGVVVDVNSTNNTSGALTVAAEFDGATAAAGGTPSTTYQTIYSSTAPVGGVGDVVTIIPRVAISATTKAATDYLQTFTVTGAGSF